MVEVGRSRREVAAAVAEEVDLPAAAVVLAEDEEEEVVAEEVPDWLVLLLDFCVLSLKDMSLRTASGDWLPNLGAKVNRASLECCSRLLAPDAVLCVSVCVCVCV